MHKLHNMAYAIAPLIAATHHLDWTDGMIHNCIVDLRSCKNPEAFFAMIDEYCDRDGMPEHWKSLLYPLIPTNTEDPLDHARATIPHHNLGGDGIAMLYGIED